MPKKQHHEEHEEHVNHEAWVIPYADLLTLLMALFLVLWASSQQDLSKLKAVSAGFADQLGVSGQGAGAGGQGVLAGSAQPDVTTTEPLSPTKEAEAMAALRVEQQQKEAATQSQSQLSGVQSALKSTAAATGTTQDFGFQMEQRGLVVSIVTEGVLFDVGSATLLPEGKTILDQISTELAKLPNDIAIEGHTDNTPIATGQFPSNWELSTARATTVVRYLIDAHGLNAKKLTATGYADERPLAADTPAGRGANRRVDIAVLSLAQDPTAAANKTTTSSNELGDS